MRLLLILNCKIICSLLHSKLLLLMTRMKIIKAIYPIILILIIIMCLLIILGLLKSRLNRCLIIKILLERILLLIFKDTKLLHFKLESIGRLLLLMNLLENHMLYQKHSPSETGNSISLTKLPSHSEIKDSL